MECCVEVSIEIGLPVTCYLTSLCPVAQKALLIVLQVFKFYTVVNNFKRTDVSDIHSDEGLQSETSVFLKLFTTM